MGTKLHIDFETHSECELKDYGLYVYANDPSTDIWVMGWAFDDDIPQIWRPGLVLPELIRYHIAQGGEIWAHNAAFEYQIWSRIGVQRYDFPIIPLNLMHCTMAMSYVMSLPGSLEGCAAALGIPEQKDMAGHRTMLKLSKQNTATNEDLEKLYAYCKKDVEVEREVGKRLLPLSPQERKIWLLDQKINERGVKVDTESIRSAIGVVETEKQRLDAEIRSVTEGAVGACTQVSRLKDWIETQIGRKLESIDKPSVLELISDSSISPNVKRALLLRQEAGKSSVSKLKTMLNWAALDGRVRGAFQYHGAGTGRWSGRGPQFQNLPRMKYEKWEIDSIFELLKRDDAADAISMFHGVPMTVISNVLRAFITA